MLEQRDGRDLRRIVKERREARSNPSKVKGMIRRETHRGWGYPNSDIFEGDASYNKYFKLVIPEGFTDIKEYIENTLAPKKGHAIALELGGIGSKLFRGFTPGFFERTASVSLTDFRNRLDPNLRAEDDARNHMVITGDMIAPETKAEVNSFLDGQKADLIITRMIGGLNSLPEEPYILGSQADYWYRQLAEGGVVFAQLSSDLFLDGFMREWRELIEEKFQGKIQVQMTENSRSLLRLTKLPGAPARLPLVPLQELRPKTSVYV